MPQRRRLSLNVLTLAISVLALLLAGYAVIRPAKATEAGPPRPSPTATATGTVTTSTSAGPSDTSVPASTNPGLVPSGVLPTVGYVPSYPDRKLRLTPNDGCGPRYVDLDTPAVTVDAGSSDVQYVPCRGQDSKAVQLSYPNQSVAEVSSASATPEDCANAITTSPASQRIILSRQLVICSLTDGTSTADQPARQRIVRLVIDNISQDGTVDLTATAWEVPR